MHSIFARLFPAQPVAQRDFLPGGQNTQPQEKSPLGCFLLSWSIVI